MRRFLTHVLAGSLLLVATAKALAAPGYTLIDYQNVGSGDTDIVVPSFTPTAGSTIVMFYLARSAGMAAGSVVPTFGTRDDGQGNAVRFWNGFNSGDGTQLPTFGTDTVGTQIATIRVADSSPGAGTITWTFTGTNRAKVWTYEVTGLEPNHSIRQAACTGSGSGVTSLSDAFELAPLSDSLLMAIGGARAATTTVAEDTGWTEVTDNTDNSQATNIQSRTSTSTNIGVSWGATQSNGAALCGIEIRNDASLPPEPTLEAAVEYDIAAGSTYTIPESPTTISPAADAWLFVPVFITDVGGTARSVSSISSGFSVTGSGWQQLVASTAVGNDAVRVEWWYAQATGSPGSGAVTITFSASYTGFHAANIFSLPSTATDDPSTGATGTATSASLSGGTELTGTLSGTPGSDSILLMAGIGAPANNQGGSAAEPGWIFIGPPAEEGGGSTIMTAHAIGDIGTAFGGLLSASGFDHTDGAAYAAIEIPAVSAGGTVTNPITGRGGAAAQPVH